MEQKKLIAIICVVVVVIAAVAAVVLLTGNDNKNDEKGMVIDGSSITQSQLDDVKKDAENDSATTLTFNTNGYKVVFDSKAIAKIDTPAELKVESVAVSSLEVKDVIPDSAKAISISFGENKSFGDGTVKVIVNQKIADGKTESDVVGLYIDGKNMTVVPTTVIDGNLALVVSHFSTYAVAYATTVYDAELKVLGNVNGDTVITQADVDGIQKLIDAGVPYELYPIADANNDGKIDSNDVDVIKDVINGSTTAIWNINYHDTDGNGTMYMELVSTKVPVTSAITTGSANTFIMLYMNGIVDEIKGASYSGTNDEYLYKETYLNDKIVDKLGTSSTSITFEDGKAGSSNVIAEKNVTLLLTDWNRTYITNEKAFEDAGVDVLRIAAASTDKEVYTHSIMLLGLVFNKVDQSTSVLKAYNDTFDAIDAAVATIPSDKIVKAVASSNNGDLSGPNSDYTAFIKRAGAEYGLTGFDFGGSSSIKVADNLGVFNTNNYRYDYIVHIRTALTYANTESDIGEKWSQYANAMSLWEHAYDGQVLVSGTVPVPVRVAYIAYAMYGDSVSALNKDWADSIEQTFESFYAKDISDAPNHQLCVTSYEYAITYEDDVIVKDENENVVAPGTKLTYGTKLFVSPTVEKDNYVFRGYGKMYNPTIMDDGSFYVVDNISLKYISQEVVDLLNGYGAKFVETYGKDQVYGTASVGTKDGSFKISSTYYTGTSQTKEFEYSYFETEEEATAKYSELQAAWEKKTSAKNILDCSDSVFDNISVRYSSNPSVGKYASSTLYICAQKGNIVIDMVSTYPSNYYLAGTAKGDELLAISSDDLLAFFTDGVKTLVKALGAPFESDSPVTPTDMTVSEIASAIAEKFTITDKNQSVTVDENIIYLAESYKSSRGTNVNLPLAITVMKSDSASEDYADLSEVLKAADGQHKAYMSTMLALYTGPAIEGVSYTALSAVSSSAVYLEFVMQCGDYIVLCSTGEGGAYFTAADSVDAVLNDFATILSGATTVSDAANGIIEKFTIADKMQFITIADKVTLTEYYKSSKGNEYLYESIITVTKSATAAEDYKDLAKTYASNDGQHKAFMKTNLALYAGPAINGVSYTALAAASSAAVYLEFVMQCGDYIIEVSTGEGGAYFAGAASADEVLNAFIAILTA